MSWYTRKITARKADPGEIRALESQIEILKDKKQFLPKQIDVLQRELREIPQQLDGLQRQLAALRSMK